MFRPARLLPWLALLAIGLVFCSSPAHAITRLQNSNIDWAYVATTGNVRFHMRFDNPDAAASPSVTGSLRPQLYGAFMPDLSPVRGFDVPSIAPHGFVDVYTEIPLQQLPPSAPTGGGPPPAGPCPPPGFWNGNVHITWAGAGGQGQAFRHMGQVLVCPGNNCTFIHVTTDCAAPAPWSVAGLCAGWNVTLYEEDQVTPSPNPVPPAWHGWLCITAASGTPVPSTCCPAITFSCAGSPGIVELCATTCDCGNPTGANPQPGTIDWTHPPGTNNVRFHVRWTNPSTSQPTAPASGEMFSQAFGVFLPNVGHIGHFELPAIQVNGFFDVFTDVPLDSLPPTAATAGGPASGGPCPPIDHWNGNIDITWNGAAGGGSVNKHIGVIEVCPGHGASLIHVASLNCTSALGMPWSVSGLCPGFY